MAKKMSERRIPVVGTPGVRVMDRGYTMGEVWVENGNLFVLNTLNGRPARAQYGTGGKDIKIRVKPEDRRRQIWTVFKEPVADYQELRNGVWRLKRLPTYDELNEATRNTVQYVKFPDFEIRAEKLAPMIKALQDAGCTEIEYDSLRRFLKM